MLLAKNRKATYEHEILQKFMAGVVLKGYEVKAIREGKAKLDGSFVQMIGNEPFVVNMHIGRYSKQSQKTSETEYKRSRKLLLNKNEITKLKTELSQKGKTAVPLALLLKHGMIKLEFAIVKGRKQHSKKQVEKERQIKRDLEKVTKEHKKFIG